MKKKRFFIAAALLAAGLWATTPSRLEFDAQASLPDLPHARLIPGTEERVIRVSADRTEWAVVALHGFSATRQETAPLAETVANQLGANLFEARLAGHGLAENALQGVKAEHWLRDAVAALERGAELGHKLIVIGTSTGATLAAAMLDQEAAQSIDTLVMISPNFKPQSRAAPWLTRPAGPLIAQLAIGDTRCWEAQNELQALYWTTCYPTATVVEVMRLVDRANRMLPAEISQRVLVFYSADDDVVSSQAALTVINATTSPAKELIEIDTSGEASDHVLAGDIMAPGNTRSFADAIVDFIERPVP